MKKAIICASFGTTHEDSILSCIGSVEELFAERYPEYTIFRAFSSSIVKKILSKRGIEVDNVEQALQRALDNGFESVIVQPTHLICGEEYEKLCREAEPFKAKFAELDVGKVLLDSDEDLRRVCEFYHQRLCAGDNMLVMMGHGSEHSANSVYGRMNDICSRLGFNDMFIGTVEASPDIESVLEKVKASEYKNITLTPLLLVAGDHARNDMAGDEPDSWKALLESEGCQVNAVVRGMGEYPEIRELYAEHLAKLMEGKN